MRCRGSGTATSNVDTVHVACTNNPTYAISGTITGLTSNGLVLAAYGAESVSPSANSGSFVFPTRLPGGADYDVTITTFPPNINCIVTNGFGTTGMTDVSNVVINCAQGQWTWFGGRGAPIYGRKELQLLESVLVIEPCLVDGRMRPEIFGYLAGSTHLPYCHTVTRGNTTPRQHYGRGLAAPIFQTVDPYSEPREWRMRRSQPGCRSAAPSWIDSAGNLWLFGGSVHWEWNLRCLQRPVVVQPDYRPLDLGWRQ